MPARPRSTSALRYFCATHQLCRRAGARARDGSSVSRAERHRRRDGVHDAARIHAGDDRFQDDVPGYGRRRHRGGPPREPGSGGRDDRSAARDEHRQPERAAAAGDGARGEQHATPQGAPDRNQTR